jgi:hypothetical protein
MTEGGYPEKNQFLAIENGQEIRTGAKLNPLGGSNFGRLALTLSSDGSSGIVVKSSAPSGSSSS